MTDQQYSLRWPNHMQSLLAAFENLLQTELLTDMTLMVEEGQMVQCHKVVLAACSSAFHKILMKNPESTVIVLLGIKYNQIKALLEYMYSGQVQVLESELDTLLRIAESLKIKGLTTNIKEDRVKEEADIQVTSPPPMVNSSSNLTLNNPPQSSQNSPPHSTENTLEAYYKSLVNRQNALPYIPSHFPLIPTFPMSSCFPSNAYNPDNVGVIALNTKKFNSVNRNSPILRNVLHQSQEDSAFPQDQAPVGSTCIRSRSNSSADDSERHSSVDGSQGDNATFYSKMKTEKSERKRMQQCRSAEPKTPSGKHGSQKMDWKRYKQYSPQDLHDAINAVKYDKMSALKASKIFSVPSRTLYDKIKRLNIATVRASRRESNTGAGNTSSSACFPYGIGGNVNGNIYNRKYYVDNENEAMNNTNNSTSSEGSPPSLSQNHHRISDWQKPVQETEEDEAMTYESKTILPRQHHEMNDCEIAEDLSMNRHLKLERSLLKEERTDPVENSSIVA